MNYKELSTVINTVEFRGYVNLALVNAATQIKGEALGSSPVVDGKRWQLADSVLRNVISFAWYAAIAKYISPQSVLDEFLTDPSTVNHTNFDPALDTTVSALWNDFAGVNIED